MTDEFTLPELADFLNREPPVFMGCTTSEILTILVSSVVVMLPPMFVVWFFAGFLIGFVGYLAFLLILGVGGLYSLQAVKNGKPAGYYQTRILLFKDKLAGKRGLITDSRRWGKNRKVLL